jgi:hypothetical protein
MVAIGFDQFVRCRRILMGVERCIEVAKLLTGVVAWRFGFVIDQTL